MEAQCKDGVRDDGVIDGGVRADGVASLIVAAGERRGLLGVLRTRIKRWYRGTLRQTMVDS